MGAPVLIGAGIGAATSLATGGNPLQGALLGGIGGGTFGGSAGIGSGFTEGGLFSLGSAIPSAGGTVATSAPTLGGLELTGATTGAVGGATTTAGTIGAGASDYVGKFVPEHLTSVTPATAPVSGNIPPILTTEGAIGTPPSGIDRAIDMVTPSGGYDPNGGNFISNMVQRDPVGSTMLANTAAQNLLNPPTAGIQPVQTGGVKKGSTQSTSGSPVNVLSPADYGVEMSTDNIPVTAGYGGALFPKQVEGFGGLGMTRRKFY